MASAPVHNRVSGPVSMAFPSSSGIVIVPVRRDLFTDLIEPDAGVVFGVAMCFLPVDISLRAYAIEAICRIVGEHGLDVAGWRNVPLIAGDAGVHVGQLVLTSPDVHREIAFERQLGRVQTVIERELASMGLNDDARVISCSCRSITYPSLDGVRPPEAWYADLAGGVQCFPTLSVPDA